MIFLLNRKIILILQNKRRKIVYVFILLFMVNDLIYNVCINTKITVNRFKQKKKVFISKMLVNGEFHKTF